MTTIPESHRDLVEAPLVGALSTIGPDEAPQVTAVWFRAACDTVRISVLADRQKFKNIAARPHATLFVVDPNNPFRTLEIRATATASDDSALELFADVFRHYGQDPETVPAEREGRMAITLTPTKVVAQG